MPFKDKEQLKQYKRRYMKEFMRRKRAEKRKEAEKKREIEIEAHIRRGDINFGIPCEKPKFKTWLEYKHLLPLENYKEYLKKSKLDEKRQETARAKDGSFELWAYYHMGLPSFSLDFWTLPELKEEKKEEAITPDKLEKMSNDEFIALVEDGSLLLI